MKSRIYALRAENIYVTIKKLKRLTHAIDAKEEAVVDKRRSQIKWLGFVLPMFAIYAVFFIYPVIRTTYYSFTDWNGLTSNFVGLHNFKRLFHDDRVITALKNTFLYAGVITVVQNTLGLGLAVLANMKIKNVKLIRLFYFWRWNLLEI